MTLGEKIAKQRKELNYTQEQLADILGVSRQSISKWESDIAYPETDKLIELGKLFDCSMDYLFQKELGFQGVGIVCYSVGNFPVQWNYEQVCIVNCIVAIVCTCTYIDFI